LQSALHSVHPRVPWREVWNPAAISASLDDSGHVVAGVVPVAATPAEEEDTRDEGKDDSGNSNKESPVEHHLVFIKAHLVVLVHESAIHANANSNADSCNMTTQNSLVKQLLPTNIFIT